MKIEDIPSVLVYGERLYTSAYIPKGACRSM